MNIPSHIFKSYDIRGVYPTDINEENADQIVGAIYKFFCDKVGKKSISVALGYDMRVSSPSLFEVAKKKLVSMGAQVIDVGLVSTPTFYFAVREYNYDAGLQITASHNPKEYTGMKFVINSPEGLIKIGKPTGMEDVKTLAIEGYEFEAEGQGTVEEKTGIVESEVDNALQLFHNPQIDKYKIVADPGNAMGGIYIDALFKKIPADLIKMYYELDGTFPNHQPDPLQEETLVDLQKRVVEEGADMGLAPDGDGDRLFFIDEKGNIVPPTVITAIVAKSLLSQNPGGKILFDIRYILTPIKVVEELGGTYEVTRVGHAFITERMNADGGLFAGESSGHYFFQATGNAESQLAVLVSVLKTLTEEKKTLSELVEEYSKSFQSGEINFEVTNSAEIIEVIKQQYNDGELNTLDGIAISYPDWRFSVRTSNTEPLLRLNVEGYNKDNVMSKTEELKSLITTTAKHE